jgi:hypothetical protein
VDKQKFTIPEDKEFEKYRNLLYLSIVRRRQRINL